jgi:retron-type reverse transcriptase
LSFFLKAHNRARRGKAGRAEVIRFERNLYINLSALSKAVITGRYHPSRYRRFNIADPKPRVILALPYRDRVVHQWLVEEFIKPYYIPRFSRDSYACIPGRGSHAAVARLREFILRSPKGYTVKMDISKFFYNIDRSILYRTIVTRVRDKKLKSLLKTVIFKSFDPEIPGLPIGNYTSQYFANIYLNELDQYAKRVLKLKFYLRYMDDFIAVLPTKTAAWVAYRRLEKFCLVNLKLSLNPKSRVIPVREPIDFCGYILHDKSIKIRKRSKTSLREIVFDFESGADDLNRFIDRTESWLGHALHADAENYARKVLADYVHLFPRLKSAAAAKTDGGRATRPTPEFRNLP